MKRSFCISIALVVCLAGLCGTPTRAVAAPSAEQTIQWLSTEQQPAFPDTLQQGNQVFSLVSSSIREASSETPQAWKEVTRWMEVAPDELQAALDSLPAVVQVDEEGFAGSIPRVSVTQQPVQAVARQELNHVVRYENLPTNDAANIPQTCAVEAPSGALLTLQLAGLEWSVDALSPQGIPRSYTASALYRGVDEQGVVDRYVVTAQYQGNVPGKEPVITYEATLHYALSAEEEPARGRGEGIDWEELLPALITAVGAATALAGVFVWVRRRDVRVCRQEGDRLKVLAQVTSRRAKDGALLVDLPARIDAALPDLVLVLRKDKANGGPLRLSQCGVQLGEYRAVEVVRLQQR